METAQYEYPYKRAQIDQERLRRLLKALNIAPFWIILFHTFFDPNSVWVHVDLVRHHTDGAWCDGGGLTRKCCYWNSGERQRPRAYRYGPARCLACFRWAFVCSFTLITGGMRLMHFSWVSDCGGCPCYWGSHCRIEQWFFARIAKVVHWHCMKKWWISLRHDVFRFTDAAIMGPRCGRTFATEWGNVTYPEAFPRRAYPFGLKCRWRIILPDKNAQVFASFSMFKHIFVFFGVDCMTFTVCYSGVRFVLWKNLHYHANFSICFNLYHVSLSCLWSACVGGSLVSLFDDSSHGLPGGDGRDGWAGPASLWPFDICQNASRWQRYQQHHKWVYSRIWPSYSLYLTKNTVNGVPCRRNLAVVYVTWTEQSISYVTCSVLRWKWAWTCWIIFWFML